jgi:hypothetical protein
MWDAVIIVAETFGYDQVFRTFPPLGYLVTPTTGFVVGRWLDGYGYSSD